MRLPTLAGLGRIRPFDCPKPVSPWLSPRLSSNLLDDSLTRDQDAPKSFAAPPRRRFDAILTESAAGIFALELGCSGCKPASGRSVARRPSATSSPYRD